MGLTKREGIRFSEDLLEEQRVKGLRGFEDTDIKVFVIEKLPRV